MDIDFRLAAASDIGRISSIFTNAIAHMNSHNINQWDEKYPTFQDIYSDVMKQEMYVLLKGHDILSAVVINEKQEDEYKAGNWVYEVGKIAVIHRLCVDPVFQHNGVGKETMNFAESKLFKSGYSSIRLDAFSQNPYALKLYGNLGYSKVGEVFFRKGKFYLCEKSLRTV